MPLQPAHETILRHGDHAVTLRASLRAAVVLDNLPGGIPGAWDSLMRQSYTSIRQVILATATDKAGAQRFLASLSNKPLAPFLDHAQAACLETMHALMPEAAEDQQPRAAGPQITLREYLTELYRYATGWLGWPADAVWHASPAEIEAAFAAHVDRLVKLTPGAEATRPNAPSKAPDTLAHLLDPENTELDPEFDRAALRALKARHGA